MYIPAVGAFVVMRKSAFRLVLESVTKTIKFWGDETTRRTDVDPSKGTRYGSFQARGNLHVKRSNVI